MNLRTASLLGWLCAGLSVQGQTRRSADYILTTETMDGGGLYATSTDYASDNSWGSITGVSSNAVAFETALHGYLGQIYEVASLQLQAAPATIAAGGASQLSGTAPLDDATFLALNGADILWAPAVFPLVSISLSGLATAGAPSVTTPAGASGSYLGVTGTGTNLLTCVVSNVAPTAAAYRMETWRDQPNSLGVAKLLRACFDLDGDALSVQAVSATSAAGGTVVLAGNVITYTPPAGVSGADTFTYTVTDTQGASAQGTVTVTILAPAGSGPSVLGITADATTATVAMAGIPNLVYQIQASTNLVDWVAIGQTTAGTNGLFQFVDTNKNLYPSRFYRSHAHP